MENKMLSLENEVDKPDWKQWLPVYGIYKTLKDNSNNKPNIIFSRTEPTSDLVFWGSALYQGVSTVTAVVGIYKLYQFVEKLF